MGYCAAVKFGKMAAMLPDIFLYFFLSKVTQAALAV